MHEGTRLVYTAWYQILVSNLQRLATQLIGQIDRNSDTSLICSFGFVIFLRSTPTSEKGPGNEVGSIRAADHKIDMLRIVT